jgi:Holliday junction DNA helicase RuvA
MIGLLRGPVVLRTAECEVIVDVAGVGYRVTVTPSAAATLMAGGAEKEATLYVHTHVREDAIVLYGFVHDDERRCFEVLIGSHGVGPALALAIMAMLSPAALSTAVLEDDLDTLCTVPGVGRKTAARLLIELKSRLDLPDLSLDPASSAFADGDPIARASRTSRAEARAALSELGYGADEIRGALDGLRDDVGVEEMLRLALRELASR